MLRTKTRRHAMDKIKQEAEKVVFDKNEEGLPIINITLDKYQVSDLLEAFVAHKNEKSTEDIEVHFLQV
jgi:hypothetical protein